ncbi:MAG: penicillin acylase family protein [Betaproteobacteria bacterium]|nr:penicillin acylase family protein [Betaproteobacteria bacterium]
MLSRGKVTATAVQQQLFQNRNFMAGAVLPDLLAACTTAPPAAEALRDAVRDGCTALAGWNRRNELDARGAHLFREFWRSARAIPACAGYPSTASSRWPPRPAKMDDATVASKVWRRWPAPWLQCARRASRSTHRWAACSGRCSPMSRSHCTAATNSRAY